jgi:hypothetical protein
MMGKTETISDAALLDELRRLETMLERTPKTDDMREHGEYGVATYFRHFESWNAAVSALGMDVNRRDNITDDELLDELHRLADELGHVPRQKDMVNKGKFHHRSYQNAFGTWNDALSAAGYEPNIVFKRPSKDVLIEYLRDFGDGLDHSPKKREMTESGRYGANTYIREFGSWNDALRAAGFELNIEPNVSREELHVAMRELSADLGRAPTRDEMDELGAYSHFPFEQEFGSWNAAVRAEELEVNHDPFKTAEWHDKSYGEGWNESTRRAVRERDGYECQDPRCGMTQAEHKQAYGRALNVHHVVGPEEFDDKSEANQPENLVSLCCVCHPYWDQLSPLRPDTAGTEVV